MGKFKVGQWVRVIDDAGCGYAKGRVGEIGKVTHVNNYDDLTTVELADGVKVYQYAYRFEPWQPKVGERVRFTTTTPSHGAHYSSGGLTVEHADGKTHITVAYDDNDFTQVCHVDDLEPLPVAQQPAALTIEAGKFYKTRDGRKVGPAYGYSDGWSMRSEGGMMWHSNGERYFSEDRGGPSDLVALWDEPAVAVAASNDKGVKVGDKVRALADDIDITEGHVYEVLEIDVEGAVKVIDDVDDNWWIDGGNFEVVSPAVANDNAATAKFKVGDRVRVVKESRDHQNGGSAHNQKIGSIFTLNEFDRKGQFWRTKEGTDFYEHEIETFVPRAASTTPAIVCLIENGQPKPAVRPFVHPDEQSAAKEASRLANVHKGKEFGVYVLTSTAKEERTYDHEWQRLAAKGEKIAAIRLLRQATGLHLATAKTAVEDWVVRAA